MLVHVFFFGLLFSQISLKPQTTYLDVGHVFPLNDQHGLQPLSNAWTTTSSCCEHIFKLLKWDSTSLPCLLASHCQRPHHHLQHEHSTSNGDDDAVALYLFCLVDSEMPAVFACMDSGLAVWLKCQLLGHLLLSLSPHLRNPFTLAYPKRL